MFTLSMRDFQAARARIAQHIKRTPLLTSRQLSELTGLDVRLKAELFQRVGSYKIRGPLNKFALMPEDEKRRGVVCSSAGNHAQGVALAAKIHGIRAVVCMAENAPPAKIAATKAYGAGVVLHGTIWDEANEKAKELVRTQGLTYAYWRRLTAQVGMASKLSSYPKARPPARPAPPACAPSARRALP